MEAAKSAYPFSSTDLVKASDEVDGFTKGLVILQDAEAELFGFKAEVTYTKAEEIIADKPTKRSKAKTEAGKARAAASGLSVE